ncbi:talin 2 [Histomonas meleagridis]|uniref:talin 2 n=1 Tax=Histomonas meleagridis TaxID=135588 RepID=UPI00355AB9CD|nr:talin 2 [Histomonas meleagridis]KAH0800203.1 talin 2 [Histomonas meleagridis]
MSSSISLITCDNIHGNNAQEFEYPDKIKGSQLLSLALQNLKIPENKNTKLLIRKKDKSYKWINPDKDISHYHLHDGMALFVLKTNNAITVLTSDGSSKKLIVDISKTVKELVSYIAEKLRIGNPIGYSLFTISPEGEHIPLNLDLSLPQQCTNYDKVFFKRRYFVFTKSQISDRASALLAYNDVSEHIKKNNFPISDEKKAELCYYSLYIVANDSDEISENSIPPDVPENVKALVVEYLSSRKAPTKEEAIGQYLTVAHSIPNFGCEIFKCKYAEGEDKNYIPCELYIGPIKIDLYNESKEIVYSIPYYRYVSVHKSKGTITIKFLLPDGHEHKLKIHFKNAQTIYAMISTYASLVKEFGAELITDGFLKEETLTTEEVDITNFTYYYTLTTLGKYLYYPGTLNPYKTKVLPLLPKFEQELPNEVANIKANCDKDMFEQDSLLHLIFNTNEIITRSTNITNAERDTINSALYMISTSNITVGSIELILSSLNILITCQKLIRSEIMVKVDSKRKTVIENWVNFLKKYRETFQDSLKELKQCPTNGTILYNTQFHLIHLLDEMKSLTAFAESVIPLSPGSSFLPAIEHFTTLIKDTLRPLIPHEPVDRLKHIFGFHQTLFSIAILLTVGNTVKNDPKIVNNQELVEKINTALISLGNAYSNANDLRQKLTIRPFSIPFFDKLKEQTIVLQRAVLDCKGITELITSITSDKTFQQALIFSKKKLDQFITLLNDVRIEPFRDIPSSQQLKALHDSLVETIVKFLNHDVKWTDSKSQELYEQVKGQMIKIKKHY